MGVALDNLALGIGIGIVIGFVVITAIARNSKGGEN